MQFESLLCFVAVLVLVHSAAGATGSGLTSQLIQELKDLYNKTYILSVTALPFFSGESSVQHYNVTLIMGALTRFVF